MEIFNLMKENQFNSRLDSNSKGTITYIERNGVTSEIFRETSDKEIITKMILILEKESRDLPFRIGRLKELIK